MNRNMIAINILWIIFTILFVITKEPYYGMLMLDSLMIICFYDLYHKLDKNNKGEEMICYKDMTFCTFYKECKNGKDCKRALTEKVMIDAKWWFHGDNPPIARFCEKPECFKGEEK